MNSSQGGASPTFPYCHRLPFLLFARRSRTFGIPHSSTGAPAIVSSGVECLWDICSKDVSEETGVYFMENRIQ